MLGKVAFKLLLVLTWSLVAADPRDCSQSIPESCMANTNIQLSVDKDHYDLQLCSNGQCLPRAGQEKWIRCDRMCGACVSMANVTYCGTNQGQCERRVSTFLDNYCSSNTPSTSILIRTTTVRETSTTTTRIPTTRRVTTTNTEVVTKTLPCQTLTSVSTTTVTHVMTPCGILTLEGSSQASTSVQHTAPVAALGALLGLFMILLAIVTTGWVWTLCVMKRKKSEKAASKANVTDRDRTMNRCFPNPTYEMNITAQEPPQTETEVTYDVVASPGQTQPGMIGNGQTYAKLNRPKRNGHKPPHGMPSQQLNDDYSQLGLVNEDAENNYSLAGWEKEGRHGGGDYADPDMEAEMVGGATEYEVPVPLRKNK